MNIFELKTEVYAHYMDDVGQVTKDKNPSHWSTGNGLLFTGTFFTLLGLSGILDSNDAEHFDKAVRACYVNPIRPVLNRDPNRRDFEGFDDYIGVCAGAFFLKSPIAKEISDWGESHCFNFNNQNVESKSIKSWFYRFSGFAGHLRLASGKSPGWIQTWELDRKFSAGCSGQSDPDILTWLEVEVARKASSRFNDSIAKWDESFKKTYGSLGKMFAPSFGAEHPFSQYN